MPAWVEADAPETQTCPLTARQELVWSGAGLFPGRPVLDFKVSTLNATPYLSLVLYESHMDRVLPNGAGVLLDSSYQEAMNVTLPPELRLNIHEFSLLDDGSAAIILFDKESQEEDLSTGNSSWSGPLISNGFREIDLRSRETLFEWNSSDHVWIYESTHPAPANGTPWDYL